MDFSFFFASLLSQWVLFSCLQELFLSAKVFFLHVCFCFFFCKGLSFFSCKGVWFVFSTERFFWIFPQVFCLKCFFFAEWGDVCFSQRGSFCFWGVRFFHRGFRFFQRSLFSSKVFFHGSFFFFKRSSFFHRGLFFPNRVLFFFHWCLGFSNSKGFGLFNHRGLDFSKGFCYVRCVLVFFFFKRFFQTSLFFVLGFFFKRVCFFPQGFFF